MDAYHILVIILASFLALFLILAITVLVFVIKIVKSVKKITDRAERTAESVGHAADFIKNAATTSSMAKVLTSVVEIVRKSSKSAASHGKEK